MNRASGKEEILGLQVNIFPSVKNPFLVLSANISLSAGPYKLLLFPKRHIKLIKFPPFISYDRSLCHSFHYDVHG